MKLFTTSMRRGFTLIELLVVIAIIGILSAVVLESLNTARAKGTDASIKSELNTVTAQGTIDYDSFPSAYAATAITVAAPAAWTVAGTATPGTAGTSILTTTAANEDQTAANALIELSKTTTLQWAVSTGPTGMYEIEAPLTATGAGYWCIDSTGQAKTETSALTVGASAAKCP